MALRYTVTMKRTTIYLAEIDRVAIKMIRKLYGMDTDSAAIRFAIRVMANADSARVVLTGSDKSNLSQDHEE